MSRPGTVTFSVKMKHLWLLVGILLALLVTTPVVYAYVPNIAYTPSTSPSPSPTPSKVNSTGNNGGSSKVTCQNPCTLYVKNSVFGFNVSQTQYVKVGTTVTWKNIDDTEHTSTSNSGVWDSGVIGVGHSYSVTFNQTGTYPYHCNIHPMTATIVVVS